MPNFSKAQAPETADFLVDSSYDATGRNSLTATNRLTGQNAYYYIEDTYWINLNPQSQAELLAGARKLSDEFDNVIYPKMRQFYATEWTPGIDNDEKIYILLTDIVKDAGGYYNPNDEYYKTRVKDGRSNQKEIIYLNVGFVGKPIVNSFLAHEFQHMINWYQKKLLSGIDEEIWLNEALSEYSAALLGYDDPYPSSMLELRVKNFLKTPSDPLLEWKNMNQDYGSISLFIRFLAEHYGSGVIKSIITSGKTGIAAIDYALASQNSAASFSKIFNDWTIANYLNDRAFQNGAYAYLNPNLAFNNLRVSPTESFTVLPGKTIENISYTKDWAGKWYQFAAGINNAPNQTLKITFSAEDPAANFKIPYIIKKIDGTVTIGSLILDSQEKGAAYINDFGTAVSSIILMPISEKKNALFTDSEPMMKFDYVVSLIQSNTPVVKNINPVISSVIGGDVVMITGENFTADTTVRFGGVPAAQIVVPDSKTIIAKIPPYPRSGAVSVEIANLNSLSTTASQLFTYLPAISDGTLIRAEGDIKVYLVKGKYKRWIQSPKIFKMYNFDWNSVTTVAPQLRDYYETSSLVRADGDYKVYEIDEKNIKHHLNMTGEQFSASGRSWESIFIISKAERNLYRTGAAITK